MEKTKTILVSNLPEHVHCDFIELFFENTKKYGGGTVIHVDYDENDASAIVEFKTTQAVDKVLENKNIKMMGQEVRVEAYRELPQCTIEVHGPTYLIRRHNLDLLQLYFESPRSKGGKTEEITFDTMRPVAFVTFESHTIAKRVTEHMNHVLKGQKLDVKLRQNQKNARISDEVLCTIRARGLKQIPSKDIVEFYFESKRRSGGGRIKSFVLHGTDENVAEVTFEDEKDAKAVVERSHTINGVPIEVSMVTEKRERPVYPDRFLVEGLQKNTSDDCLAFFFEAKIGGVKAKSLAYHRDKNDVVLVIMKADLDVAHLIHKCKNETAEGAILRVSEVTVSNCIYVGNLPADVNTYTIELYFENTKRSKGGPVEKVELIDDTSCLVYFEDYRVISDILNQLHNLSHSELRVCLYLEYLKLTEEEALSSVTPQPVTVTDMDVRKIEFLMQDAELREDVERILLANHAKVEWPKQGFEEHGVTIVCTAHTSVVSSNRLTRRWQRDITATFENLMDKIYIHTIRLEAEHFSVDSSVDCMTENDKFVKVLTDRDTSTITIVGASAKLDTAIRSVYGTSGDADEEFKEEKVTLVHEIEFEMLESMNFENRVRALVPDIVIKMAREDFTVAFEGRPLDIRTAKLLMFEMKNEFSTAFTDTLYPESIELYCKRQTTYFVNAKLRSNNLQCLWRIADQKLIICCQKQYNFDRCVDVIKSSVVHNVIHLRENEAETCTLPVLKEKLVEWQQMYPEKVITSLKENCRLHLCSTDDISQRLLADVLATTQKLTELKQAKLKDETASSSEEYVNGDTVVSATLKCGRAKVRFLKMHRKELIQEVENMSGRYKVKLAFQDDNVVITGSRNGIAGTMKKFTGIFETLKCETHYLNVALRDVLLARKEQGPIADTERETRCIVIIPEENMTGMQSENVECDIIDTGKGFLEPVLGQAVTEMQETLSVKSHIYSDRKANIERCKTELVEKLYTKKKIETYKEILKSLTQDEIKELDVIALANIYIDTQAGVITIEGPINQVTDVTHELQMKLLRIERKRHNDSAAEELFKLVQWQYEEVTQTGFKLIPYNKRLNHQIEHAYKANNSVFEFDDDDGDTFVIDFKQLIEYRKSDDEDKLRVLRKDILKAAASALPEEWADMKENENIKVVSLPTTDQTYLDISNRFLTEVKTGSYAHRLNFNPNNLKVNKIERIQNKTLYQQYHAKRKQMTEQKPNLPGNMPIERELWLGIKYDAVTSIQMHGFNRTYIGNANGEPWYGEGVYFSSNASYTARGWLSGAGAGSEGYMFLVKTLSGQMCKGQKGMRYLPPVNAKDPTILYDCAVNNLQKPMEFVIFNDTQAYPAYIITFTT